LVIQHNNQPIVGDSNGRDDGEDAQPGWSILGGVFPFWGGSNLNDKKNTKNEYNKGLRWLPFNILHATTNQKHTGMMEGGWDRTRNHVRTLGERQNMTH
jgi:hypothetical protein